MSSEIISVQLYSHKPLEQSVRESFGLDNYPQESEEVKEYLKGLGIVFYRDDVAKHGIIIPPDDKPLGESLVDDIGWIAYYSLLELDAITLQIREFEVPEYREDAIKFKARCDKVGDTKSWFVWNKQVVVNKMTEAAVTIS